MSAAGEFNGQNSAPLLGIFYRGVSWVLCRDKTPVLVPGVCGLPHNTGPPLVFPKWNAIKRGWFLSLTFFPPSHTVISPNATSWWFFYAGLVGDDWCRTPNLRSYFLGFSGMGFHSMLISACYVWAERWMFQYLLYLKTRSILKTAILHMKVSKAFSHVRLFQTRIQWNNLECLI